MAATTTPDYTASNEEPTRQESVPLAGLSKRHRHVVAVGECTEAARGARELRYTAVADESHRRAKLLLRVAHGEMPPYTEGEPAEVRMARIKLHGLAPHQGKRGDLLADSLAISYGLTRTVDGHREKVRDYRTARTALLSRARVYERKARGQHERIKKVLACKTEAYELVGNPMCPACAEEVKNQMLTRCEGWRYCMPCRSERCREYRARLNEAIEQARIKHERKLSGWRRWSEKMLTITIPHSGSSAYDLAKLQKSWAKGKFLSRLKNWFTPHSCKRCRSSTKHAWMRPSSDVRIKDGLPFARVLELTGSDGGHAHAHVWMMTPYLPHWVLRTLLGFSMQDIAVTSDDGWLLDDSPSPARAVMRGSREAAIPVRAVKDVMADPGVMPPGPLCKAYGDDVRSRRCEHPSCRSIRQKRLKASAEIRALAFFRNKKLAFLPWPVLDIREAYGEVGNEIAKYMTKDAERDPVTRELHMVEPAVYAEIVEATEERRMVCVSRYFWVKHEPKLCECCGWGRLRSPIRSQRASELPPGPRGPPLPYIQEAQLFAPPRHSADPREQSERRAHTVSELHRALAVPSC